MNVFAIRHGETAWSLSGQHTGRTDLPLTDKGRRLAERLRPALAGEAFALVLVSPLRRARETVELAGLGGRGRDASRRLSRTRHWSPISRRWSNRRRGGISNRRCGGPAKACDDWPKRCSSRATR